MKNSRFLKAASLFCLCAALIYFPSGLARMGVSAAEQSPAAVAEGVVILSEEEALDTLEQIPDEPIPASVTVLHEEGPLSETEVIPDEAIPADTTAENAIPEKKNSEMLPLNGVTILDEEGSRNTLEEIPDEPIPASANGSRSIGLFVGIGAVILIALAAGIVCFMQKKKKKQSA